MEYRFIVESTKIEDVSLSYKTATSEANIKADKNGVYKMGLSQRTEFCQ